jgi:hypothetical protein
MYIEMSNPYARTYQTTTSDRAARKALIQSALQQNQQLQQLIKTQDDVDILTAKNSLTAIRKANPKLIVRIWMKYVATPYNDKILAGDINFFIEKDYANDLTRSGNQDQIMDSIDRLRKPVKNMNPDNQQKTMKYIQNLCKIAAMIPT